MKKVTAIIQARMGSTRLPGKVMKNISGRTVLYHVVERTRQANFINDILLATTTNSEDDILIAEAQALGVKVYRGSEEDVLSRYYYGACQNKSDVIVRITSDCPLIDPLVIDKMLSFYLTNNYILVSNAGANLANRTFPRGLDTEIFSFSVLEKAYKKAKDTYQKEHVTPYIYENYCNSIYFYKNDVDYSYYRLTIDTTEDFQLITEIYNHLYYGVHDFYFLDIMELLKIYPELAKINQYIKQKKLKE